MAMIPRIKNRLNTGLVTARAIRNRSIRPGNAAVLLLLAGALAGCGDSAPVKLQGTVKARIERPGGGAAAIITEVETDALSSNAMFVYAQSDKPGSSPDLLLKADKNETAQIRWIDRSHLLIDVPCGRIWDFTNSSWLQFPQSGSDGDMIVVTLKNSGGVCK